MKHMTLDEFTAQLSSRSPVPGGGGASALTGALAASLSSMVCALTTGKKKYASFEEDIQRISHCSHEYCDELLALIERDANAFEPLSRAYSIPKDDPNRAEIMERALKLACEPPIEIMRVCGKIITMCGELAEKGSALAVSDVGASVALAKAALLGASLNIYINAASMRDREYAEKLLLETKSLTDENVIAADETFKLILTRLQ